MNDEARTLRARSRQIGDARLRGRRAAVQAHLVLPLGERLRVAVALSDAFIRDRGRFETIDDEVETWTRVNPDLLTYPAQTPVLLGFERGRTLIYWR